MSFSTRINAKRCEHLAQELLKAVRFAIVVISSPPNSLAGEGDVLT